MKDKKSQIVSKLLFFALIVLTCVALWARSNVSTNKPNESQADGTPETQFQSNGLSGLINGLTGSKPNNTPAANETEIIQGELTPILEIKDDETGEENLDPLLPDGSYLRVDYVDVGQADFILVECDGHYMTIDGGNVADSQFVYSYLDQRGIDYLDYVVVTHAHEDHCGAVSAILSKCQAGMVYSPVTTYSTKAFSNVVKKAEEQGLDLTVPSAGDTFIVGSAECEIIGPVKEYSEPNDTSIVIRMQYGNTSYLFTGDAEETAEKDILSAGYEVKADVLKVGHHGSNTSTSYIWLRQVAPTYAVISSNKTEVPKYGHPHESTLSKLRDADVTVFRTDMQGTITCVSDGESITFTTERNADADTLAS